MDFDVVVIGAGPGGYHAAIRAAQCGLKVAVVEKDDGSGIGGLGGVCLNWGCIPSKSLLKNAELVNHIKDGEQWGLKFDSFEADMGVAVERSRNVSKKLTSGIASLLRKNSIELVKGTAKITGECEVTVDSKRTISAKNIVIATGARARDLPNISIDGKDVIGSREALDLRDKPKSIAVVGASAIGCEFAYYFNAYGVKVHLIEVLDRVVPKEDEDVSRWLERSFKKSGIDVVTKVSVTKVEKGADGLELTYKPSEGSEASINVEKILLGVGVTPNTENLGLEEAGVELKKGYVKVNGYMQTNVPSIYAVGDVTGKLQLAHVAFQQGVIAAERIANKEVAPLNDYTNIPKCTYCQPEVASFGVTEKEARDAGLDIKVSKVPYAAAGKSVAIGEGGGFCKIVASADTSEILGAHIVGAQATELIAELSMVQFLEGGTIELEGMVHAHPTLSELLKEAGGAIQNKAIHF